MEQKIKTLSDYKSNIQLESDYMFSFFLHSHTYYEMTLYDPFEGNITVNDYTVSPDTLTAILVAPSYFHKGTVNGKCGKYRKLVFGTEMLQENLIPNTSIVLRNIEPESFFVRIYEEIFQNAGNEEYKKVLINAAVCIMLSYGEKLMSFKGRNIGFEAIRIINDNFDKPLTLSCVAKQLHITPQYLSNAFKAEIEMSFSAYLTSVRLHRAAKMLTETKESVTNICDACGYGNFSNFLRSFKKTYGMSPMTYRKQNKA
ncbi:MAG: helix-turn-helix transcriptional regulator [Clostridia bacterium]|nr:helix-turn-helix transcriptional regulator [Clostridia bacterium]MBR6603659.1 helix-turn-helix transcriptional regulator [Clostridia bacterium]